MTPEEEADRTAADDAVKLAESELDVASKGLEKAKETHVKAVAAEKAGKLALAQSSSAKAGSEYNKICDDLSFTAAALESWQHREREAKKSLEDRHYDAVDVERARVRRLKRTAIQHVLALEADAKQHVAAIAEIRTKQQQIVDDEIRSLQTTNWIRTLPPSMEPLEHVRRPQGHINTVGDVLADYQEELQYEERVRKVQAEAAQHLPRVKPTRSALTDDEKHQLLHVIETQGIGTCGVLRLSVGLQPSQLYAIAGQSGRAHDTATASQAEVTPELLAEVAAGLPRALAECAVKNGKPYSARKLKKTEAATTDEPRA